MGLKLWFLAAAAAFSFACSDDTTGGSNNGTENNGANNGSNNPVNNGASNNGTENNGTENNAVSNNLSGNNTTSPVFPVNEQGQVLCGDRPCECDDGIDNDGDGLIDGFDPECTGPYDDDEGSFATGIPGDNKDPIWQDCFFDGNSGHGDDGCRYKTGCLTGELPPDHRDCTVAQRCIDFCRPYAPNGCDCFGCCEIYPPGESDPVFIIIGTSCSIAELDNPDKCQTCRQSTQCVNVCGECELCGGKKIEDLPASCYPNNSDPNNPPVHDPDNPIYTCDDGEQVCSETIACTTAGEYCSQGCCIRIFN